MNCANFGLSFEVVLWGSLDKAILFRYSFSVLNQCLMTWTYILVDEFQDTSTMQYKLLCLLASHKRVTVVGDDDQVSSLFKIQPHIMKTMKGLSLIILKS